MCRFRLAFLRQTGFMPDGQPEGRRAHVGFRASFGLLIGLVSLFNHSGCGTTKWSETRRTATEQLLISDSMDQAVGRIDFRPLTGKKVYLDDTYLKDVVDASYLISSLRQQLLAHGAILKDKKDEADYVLEVRSGAVGTDQHSVLVGIPQVDLPPVVTTIGIPTALPEIPLIKKTRQSAVTKILLFAYNRKTGRPLWQSGLVIGKSDAQDVWFFGAGPFQKGTIYQGTQFAGERLPIRLPDVPLIDLSSSREPVSLLQEAFYAEPISELSQDSVGSGPPKDGATVGPAPRSMAQPETLLPQPPIGGVQQNGASFQLTPTGPGAGGPSLWPAPPSQ